MGLLASLRDALGLSPAAPQPAALPTAPQPPVDPTLTASFEGYRAVPYQDQAGIWTIGYGSTRDLAGNPVSSSTPPVTEDQARTLLLRDLSSAVATVAADVQEPLTDNQRAALVDFVYNVGAGNFGRSALLKDLNARQNAAAAAQFPLWNMAGGKPSAGLARRRAAEETLFKETTLSA